MRDRQGVIDVFTALTHAYLLLGFEGLVLHMNPSAQRLLTDEAAPRSLRDVVEDETNAEALLARWRSSTTSRPGIIYLQGRSTRAEGFRMPRVEAIAVRLERPGARSEGLATLSGQVQDLSLRRRRQELDHTLRRRRSTHQRLEALHAEAREHTCAVAHDVRTPLFTFRGAGRRLEAAGHVDAEGGPYLALLLDASEHLHGVTESLLDIARLDRREWDAEAVEPAAILREVVDDLAADLERAGATVEFGELPAVLVDPGALWKVFLELMKNSIRYRADERPLCIVVRSRWLDGHVEIRVDGNGRGLPPGPDERLFGLFQGGIRDGGTEGRGIGLATCRRLVTRGGTIRCVPSSKPGSRFAFTAPSGRPPAPGPPSRGIVVNLWFDRQPGPTEARPSPTAAAGSRPSRRGQTGELPSVAPSPSRDPALAGEAGDDTNVQLRVVMVDDDARIRALARMLLDRSQEAQIVAEASDGDEALTMVQDLKPDVVLLDLLMPRVDGRTVLPTLVRDASETMVVVLSALGGLDEADQAFDLGAFAYLEKSVVGPDLGREIKNLHQLFRRALAGEKVWRPTGPPRIRR